MEKQNSFYNEIYKALEIADSITKIIRKDPNDFAIVLVIADGFEYKKSVGVNLTEIKEQKHIELINFAQLVSKKIEEEYKKGTRENYYYLEYYCQDGQKVNVIASIQPETNIVVIVSGTTEKETNENIAEAIHSWIEY